MGTAHMGLSMHVYTLTETNREWDFHEGVCYYASKRKAQAKAVELAAKQARAEEEDWIANPCECGERNCYRRDQFLMEWSVRKFDLAELSMRELMQIELEDADED